MRRGGVSQRAHVCMHALAAKLRLAACDEKLQMLPAFYGAIKRLSWGKKQRWLMGEKGE